MAKFIAGLLIGLLLGTVAEVGSDPSPSLSWASSSISIESFAGPTSFVFVGKGPQELLRINTEGTVTYQGRVLGTDKEVWDGLRAVFNPWRVCQEFEEDMRWLKP